MNKKIVPFKKKVKIFNASQSEKVEVFYIKEQVFYDF